MNTLEETKYLINKYKVNANKKLGQNFLVSDIAINNIIEYSDIKETDLIIEIGPGLGTLTKEILEKKAKVIAIELDNKMLEILKERFVVEIINNKLKLIKNDVLKVNLDTLIKEEKNSDKKIKNVKVIANLPYYISTPIIMKLLEEKINIDEIIVMVQKEVADRIKAMPGTREAGAITYEVDYYANVSKIIEVDKTSFIPMPKVDSEVIKMKIRQEPPIQVISNELFFKLIKLTFMQRRKTLTNVLVNANIMDNKEEVHRMLNEINLREDIRGESLSMEEFSKIANYINNKQK